MIHKTTRSILSVLLAALLLVTSIPLTPAFAGEGAVSPQSESGERGELTGSGMKDNPYQIGSAAELRKFAKLVNGGETTADAVLTADIDLSEICSEEEGDSWTPIGTYINSYKGTFDGNEKTISGLYINSSGDAQGLFGRVNGGTVKEFTVSGKVSGTGYVGGIVGYSSGSVENCTFSGTVNGSGNSVGGVVGWNGGPVANCYNTGTVTGGLYSNVGGVVGYNQGRAVNNCTNTGSVTGGSNSSVGGVVGQNGSSGSGSSCTVENCYNTGDVSVTSGENSNVGGVVGV